MIRNAFSLSASKYSADGTETDKPCRLAVARKSTELKMIGGAVAQAG